MGDRLDPKKLTPGASLPLRYAEAEGQVFLPISPGQGGAVVAAKGQSGRVSPPWPASLDAGNQDKGRFEPERRFLPFWRNGAEAR